MAEITHIFLADVKSGFFKSIRVAVVVKAGTDVTSHNDLWQARVNWHNVNKTISHLPVPGHVHCSDMCTLISLSSMCHQWIMKSFIHGPFDVTRSIFLLLSVVYSEYLFE